jgi:outer membrane protein OmpU
MKRSLIGTTAIVTAGMLAASATANAADPIKLSVGGYMNAAIGWISEDDTSVANVRSEAIQLDSEIVFRGATVLDNGLEVGVKVEMATDGANAAIDEQMLYIENEESWGRIEIGSEDGASDQFRNLGPFVIGGSITGCATFSGATGTNGVAAFACGGAEGDRTKVTYRGPKLLGMQWGISYTPERTDFASLGDRDDGTGGEFGGTTEFGANFSTTLAGASISVGGGLAQFSAEAAGEEDSQQWNLGGTVTVGNIRIGGSWKNQEVGPPTTGDTDQTHFRLGITTNLNGTTVGVEYYAGENEVVNNAVTVGDDETTVLSIAANRSIGPGVSIGAKIASWDMSDEASVAANENSVTEFLVITSVGF